jgi:hypothetical protein
MEPSGRNRWQSVANGTPAKAAQKARTVAVGCDQLPEAFHGKGAPPLRKGGGRLPRSAKSSKPSERDGPQDLAF